jgi:hypothetical protein
VITVTAQAAAMRHHEDKLQVIAKILFCMHLEFTATSLRIFCLFFV